MAREVADSQMRMRARDKLRLEEHKSRRTTPRWCDIPTVEDMAAIAAATGNDELKRHVTALRSYARRYIGSDIPAAVNLALEDVRGKRLPGRPIVAAVASAPVRRPSTASMISQRWVSSPADGYNSAAVDRAWYRIIPARELHADSFYYWKRPA